MSGFSFSQNSIENLKNQINIVDVIGQVVPLKRAGSNFKGLCPFHREKTPSFVVSEQKQYFTCFGCGASGDAIEFVKRYYNMEFPDAVEKLAEDNGITLEKSHYDDNRSEYYEINRMAAQFFYDAFTQRANKGYSYMKNRGIAPATMKKFGLGYADEKWDSLYKYLLSKGVEEKKMQELGLISVSKGKCYDKFRNRVMFPIINTSGKVIGFGGRAIDPNDNPKYLNSPESRIFQKKNNLYGLNISRQAAGKEGYIILVEGYMDAIALYQSGIRNVAASLGTALTENQAKLLHRYVKEVVLSYDADNAGRAAALRGIEILRREGSKVKVLHVTDGKDPDEYVRKYGHRAFLELVGQALSYGDYKLESAKVGLDLTDDEERLEYMNRAVEIISAMSPLEQEVYKQKLARELSVSESAFDRELSARHSKPRREAAERREDPSHAESLQDVSALEKTLLKLVFTDPSYIPAIREKGTMVQSPLAVRILSAAESDAAANEITDPGRIADEMDEDGRLLIREIMEQVMLDPDHDQVFRDCVRTWKKDVLARREKDILLQLSIADEENNAERIRTLSDELIEIQKQKNR